MSVKIGKLSNRYISKGKQLFIYELLRTNVMTKKGNLKPVRKGDERMAENRKMIASFVIENRIILIPERIKRKSNHRLTRFEAVIQNQYTFAVLKDFSRAGPQPLLPRTHVFTPTV